MGHERSIPTYFDREIVRNLISLRHPTAAEVDKSWKHVFHFATCFFSQVKKDIRLRISSDLPLPRIFLVDRYLIDEIINRRVLSTDLENLRRADYAAFFKNNGVTLSGAIKIRRDSVYKSPT